MKMKGWARCASHPSPDQLHALYLIYGAGVIYSKLGKSLNEDL